MNLNNLKIVEVKIIIEYLFKSSQYGKLIYEQMKPIVQAVKILSSNTPRNNDPVSPPRSN